MEKYHIFSYSCFRYDHLKYAMPFERLKFTHDGGYHMSSYFPNILKTKLGSTVYIVGMVF